MPCHADDANEGWLRGQAEGGPSLLPFDLWVGNNLHGFQIKFHVRKKEGDAHIGRNTPRIGDTISAHSVSGCKKGYCTVVTPAMSYNNLKNLLTICF